MTNRDHSTFRLDRRAVSEVVGYTLLIGITTVTVVALLIAATTLQGALASSAETETIEQDMQDVDATFGRLAQGDNRSSVRVRTEMSNHLSVVREGEVTVLVNKNCTVGGELSSIRYDKDGETYAHELGGTIRVTDGGQAMVSSPDLSFSNGTVDLTITNITGRTASSMTFVKDVTNSRGVNDTDQDLFAGDCSQPDNVTVSITSDFADAWERYVEDEFPAGTVNRTGDTVNVTLERAHLPEELDPNLNTVVNLRNNSQYELNSTKPSITIDKPDDSNVYHARVMPIYNGIQVTRSFNKSLHRNLTRDGIDTVLITDKSGSMVAKGQSGRWWDPYKYDSHLEEKYDNATDGAQLFISSLNTSVGDRVGLVYYDDESFIHTVNGKYLTTDLSSADSEADTIWSSWGSTRMDKGLANMLAVYDMASEYPRDKYAILLTDGQNFEAGIDTSTIDKRTKKLADRADKNGVRIFTIGYGSDANNELLAEIANKTGGENYTASNKEELKDRFETIADQLTTNRKIVHDPTSLSFQAGTTYKPSIPVRSDYLANTSDGYVNINDPTTPVNFSLTFSVEDGQEINFTNYEYNCSDWRTTGEKLTRGSNEYEVTRCAELNESSEQRIDGEDIFVYTNENNTSDVIHDLGTNQWYQEDLADVLDPYTNSTGHFTFNNNTALIGVNYTNNRRMIYWFEIGKTQQELDLSYIVDVKIDIVEVEEKAETNS
jgi:FlaG/FlaF family flagellin (archaellin)